MHSEDIDKFLTRKQAKEENDYVKITFKKRESIYGLFLKGSDYADLKAKNFWRIVPQSRLEDFKRSGDTNLARIYNGEEFSRLTAYADTFE
jgi:hypothetical protein